MERMFHFETLYCIANPNIQDLYNFNFTVII